MMLGYDMTGAGWVWMVGGLVVLVLAIIGGWWLIARTQNSRPLRATPLDILQERFARGDISHDDYEKAQAGAPLGPKRVRSGSVHRPRDLAAHGRVAFGPARIGPAGLALTAP